MTDARILVFETYERAARAVIAGEAQAYASVARAHRSYLDLNPRPGLAVVDIPPEEKPAQLGAFAFAKTSSALLRAVDEELDKYIGSPAHRELMKRFGFSAPEVDLVALLGSRGSEADPG